MINIEQLITNPWFITNEAMAGLRLNLELALNDIQGFSSLRDDDDRNDEVPFPRIGSTAIISIHGTIFPRSNFMTRFFGGTALTELNAQLKAAAADESIRNIVLDIDSPGGNVGGLSETSNLIRNIRQEKPVLSVATGLMASAAYFLGSAATKVFASPSASVGSVGTIMIMQDASKFFDEIGIKFEFIRSTPLKAIGSGLEPLTDDARAEFQRRVDSYNEQFIQNIAENRQISIEEARKMADARVHISEDAKELGFVDDIATVDEIVGSLEEEASFEDKFNALSASYTKMCSDFETYQLKAQEKIEQQEQALAKVDAEHQTAKVEAAVRELTEGIDARFAPMAADTLREKLIENFDANYAIFTDDNLHPKGAVAPKSLEIDDSSVPTEENEDVEKGLVAKNEDEARIYEMFGRTYTKAYN
jgi:signal peptide peptidase SppA